jgi:RNA polymerase sigma-70 factor (ECF subfamily)
MLGSVRQDVLRRRSNRPIRAVRLSLVSALERSDSVAPAKMTLPPPTDEALMSAFAAGDEAAFRTLFERHSSATLSFLYGCMSNRELAEDLLQETFSRVCRHRDDWTAGARGGEGDSFRAWLFAIARNIARDAGRRATVRKRAAEELESNGRTIPTEGIAPAPEPPPDEKVANERTARKLLAALDDLPAAQREAFVMVRLKELSYEEVATALGTTVAASKMRVARATAALADILGDELEGLDVK